MTHDIVVCGAGPAGSVLARRLAAAGLRVALIGAAARPGWEGLSSRSRALLSEEGIDVQGEVIAGPFERRGEWANGRRVAGAEWLVERSALAAAASARSREEGADYRWDMVTSTARAGDQWRVGLRGGDVLVAPMMVDARGRRARSSRLQTLLGERNESLNSEVLRDGPRRSGPVLLAIGQRFRRRGTGTSGTGIGVTDMGWCWWAEQGEVLWIQIIGKPRSLHPGEWVSSAAEQIPALARVLGGACVDGAAVARAAHAQLGGAPGTADLEPSFWSVGDAAMALDPLSGQGVYEAIRGARLVATAIRSVIAGEDARVAQRFVGERREEAWLRGVRVAADFYRQNGARGRFWRDTAAEYEALLPEYASTSDEALPAERAPAYEALVSGGARQRPAAPLMVARAGCTRIERRPVLDQGRIVEREVVVTADHPRGVWHVAGVPLAALRGYLETAEHATVDAAAVALDRTPAAVASAMNWLRERGHLLQRDPPRVSSGG